MGGAAFTASMIWAQAMPFVALRLYGKSDQHNDDNTVQKRTITYFLICSFVLWLLMNIFFFSTIDLAYLNTFFGFETAPQCCVRGYREGRSDEERFAWVFGSRTSYSKPIHGEIRTWVTENIEAWRADKPKFFNVLMIPDEFLPAKVFREEGGAKRRRSSVSLREIFTPAKEG